MNPGNFRGKTPDFPGVTDPSKSNDSRQGNTVGGNMIQTQFSSSSYMDTQQIRSHMLQLTPQCTITGPTSGSQIYHNQQLYGVTGQMFQNPFSIATPRQSPHLSNNQPSFPRDNVRQQYTGTSVELSQHQWQMNQTQLKNDTSIGKVRRGDVFERQPVPLMAEQGKPDTANDVNSTMATDFKAPVHVHEDVSVHSQKSLFGEENVIGMLSKLDVLHASVETEHSYEATSAVEERRKISFERKTLMDLRYCPLAQIKPPGLPDFPEIILEQIQEIPMDATLYSDYRKPREDYALKTKGVLDKSIFPKKIKQKKAVAPKPKTIILENIDSELAADDLNASDMTENASSTENISFEINEVPGKINNMESDNQAQLLCDLCLTDGYEERAHHYCTDCNEFLCHNCARVHRKSKASKHHSLLENNDMPKGKAPDFREMTCEKHVHEPLKYFCDMHRQGCCTLCITTEHYQCKFEYIDDVARNYEESDEYKTCLKDINDVVKQVKENLTKSILLREKVHEGFEKVFSDINAFRVDINNRLDELEKSMKREMCKVRDSETEKLDNESTRCQSIIEELKQLKADLNDKHQYQQRKQLFLSTKTAQPKINECSNKVNSISKELTMKEYSFERNEELLSFLKSSNFGSLYMTEKGKIEQRNEGTFEPSKLQKKGGFERPQNYPDGFRPYLPLPLPHSQPLISQIQPPFTSPSSPFSIQPLSLPSPPPINPSPPRLINSLPERFRKRIETPQPPFN